MTGTTLADLLWSAPRRPRRGPRPRVDLAGIVAAAVLVADEDGLDAASMQHVADAVRVTKMALYRYVPGRAELVALMIESALDPAPDLTGDWRTRLRAWADAMRAALTRHRWVAAAAVGGRLIGPTEARWLEVGLAALDGLGLPAAQRLDTLALISSHVRGMVQQQTTAHPELTIGTLLTDALRQRTEFPLTTAALTEAMGTGDTDDAYRFGLDRILDGINALIRTAPRPL